MKKYSVFGVNQANLINVMVANKVRILSMNKLSNTQVDIIINNFDKKIFLEILNKKNYPYSQTNYAQKWIAFICGVFVVGLFFFITSLFCWKIEIVGENMVDLQFDIEQKYVGKLWKDIDCEAIQNTILLNKDVGLVSVSKRGGALIIDFSPYISKNDNITANFSGIVSNFSGIVSNIFVTSGTALVKVGDSVSIGQMLIAPYWMNKEEKVVCEAKGEVSFYVWQSETVEFREDDLQQERSGNYLVSTKLIWGNQILVEKVINNEYLMYEKVEKIEYFSKILPIKLVTTYFYELVDVPYHRDFESEKGALVMLARQKLLTNINESDILEEKSAINEVEGTYYVSYYVKLEIENG
ncbi:MAG: sporulation protein YqfD [Clostridia bacterium]|nr:sporulation protein YqfD [Clostridia bacterium]